MIHLKEIYDFKRYIADDGEGKEEEEKHGLHPIVLDHFSFGVSQPAVLCCS